MLAISKKTALNYSKVPELIATSDDNSIQIFYVPDHALPAQNIDICDPLELISKAELFKIRQKYRVPQKVFAAISKCYKDNDVDIDLADQSLSSQLAVQAIEDRILARLKKEYRARKNIFPFFAPEDSSVRNNHVSVVAASSAGKTWWITECIKRNYADSTVYVFTPTPNDHLYQELRDSLSKKRIKLINSNDIRLPLRMKADILPGSVCVFDDPDATVPESLQYTSSLQSELLFHGRHHVDKKSKRGCVVFSVFHDSFTRGKSGTKSAAVESTNHVIFPWINKSVSSKYCKNRLHMNKKEIEKVFKFTKPTDRWCMIKTSVPNCCVTKSGVLLL
jgi:hypothetical protein